MKKQSLLTVAIVVCICALQSCATFPCTTMKMNLAGVHSRIVGDGDSWSGAMGAQAGVDALIPFNCNIPLATYAGLRRAKQCDQ